MFVCYSQNISELLQMLEPFHFLWDCYGDRAVALTIGLQMAWCVEQQML
jgi:hypothetical protein